MYLGFRDFERPHMTWGMNDISMTNFLFGFRESRWPNMLVKYNKIQPGKDRKLPVKLMFGMKALCGVYLETFQ